MADPKKPDRPSANPKSKLQESEIVARLVPDPAQLQHLVVLVGFVGRSPQEGYWRLYLTPSLNRYVEIEEGNIAHSEPVRPSQASLGAVRLWVRSNVPLIYTQVKSRQIQAEFLQGSIMSRFARTGTRLPSVMAERLVSSARRISINYCPSDPGSTCEDVCVHTHFGFGCGGDGDDADGDGDDDGS